MELSKLNNAFFVKIYEDSQRVYVWFGGLGVSIYDLELNEIDYFTMAEASELYGVIRTIELHEDEIFVDEDCTDDMFITHEMETGFWQEVQT